MMRRHWGLRSLIGLGFGAITLLGCSAAQEVRPAPARATGVATVPAPKPAVVQQEALSVEEIVRRVRDKDAAGVEACLRRLPSSDGETRKSYLLALRDSLGAPGLLRALSGVVTKDIAAAFQQRKEILDLVSELNDSRGADALAHFIAGNPHIHFQTRAALALAAIGDLRAVPTLAKRLRLDPLKIYNAERDYEEPLTRDDSERVVAARHLADLADFHSEQHAQIRKEAEDALLYWIGEQPSPHANGMRALVAMRSERALRQIRVWASPEGSLPTEWQPPPMPEEWVIAQSALRYLGKMRDEASWHRLDEKLRLRPKDVDVTMERLMQGGPAILGMCLRAAGVGAADGFSEWGDSRAFNPLLNYIRDPLNNEQSRMQACSALGWVANSQQFKRILQELRANARATREDEVRRECLLESLQQRPNSGIAQALLPFFTPNTPPKVRESIARAIARSGIEPNVEQRLLQLLKDERLMTEAALALMLGGSPESAAAAVAKFEHRQAGDLERLQKLWFRSFGFFSREDLAQGVIFRYVRNAEAILHVEFAGSAQAWAQALLERQFENLIYDNGPHSITRNLLRVKLWQLALNGDAETKKGAIRTLGALHEQGVLLALCDAAGSSGDLAREEYRERYDVRSATRRAQLQLPAWLANERDY